MHPPPFRRDHRLSDWPDCHLEVRCCKGTTIYPLRLLAERHGNRTFADLLARLRCSRCGGRPAPIYLCAGQHRAGDGTIGITPDWAIELVSARRSR